TPTPARPTTRSFGAASMTLRVTLVSDRTTIASTSLTMGTSSASGSRFSSTVTFRPGCCLKYSIPFGEIGSQINTFINRTAQFRSAAGGGQTISPSWKTFEVGQFFFFAWFAYFAVQLHRFLVNSSLKLNREIRERSEEHT